MTATNDRRKKRKRNSETLTAIILKKSSSPRVSKIDETVCFAIVKRSPFMLPLTSTKITTSFGEVAAWMYLRDKTTWYFKYRTFISFKFLKYSSIAYHFLFLQSNAMTPFSSGSHLIPV